jgi:hypothetical protein
MVGTNALKIRTAKRSVVQDPAEEVHAGALDRLLREEIVRLEL